MDDPIAGKRGKNHMSYPQKATFNAVAIAQKERLVYGLLVIEFLSSQKMFVPSAIVTDIKPLPHHTCTVQCFPNFFFLTTMIFKTVHSSITHMIILSCTLDNKTYSQSTYLIGHVMKTFKTVLLSPDSSLFSVLFFKHITPSICALKLLSNTVSVN